MHMDAYFTHHCVDDDPITEEILEANHQALPSHIRNRKELIEHITDLALDAYLAAFDATGSNAHAEEIYNSTRLELLQKFSIIIN
jgi:hypothetical protein